MKVTKSTPNILSPEDKKMLKRTAYYLKSLGASSGSIRTYIDGENLDEDSFNFNRTQYFDNLYGVEIPHFAIPVLQKILSYIIDNGLFKEPDVDGINSEAVEFLIDCDSEEISFQHDFSYYGEGEGETNSYTEDDYDETGNENPVTNVFRIIEDDSEITPRNGFLNLRYNGSGDSGYIDDYFEEGGAVPSDIANFCYDQLENQHGGWEINEGSQGNFEFDIKNKVIYMNHTNNTEENETDTLFEESFK